MLQFYSVKHKLDSFQQTSFLTGLSLPMNVLKTCILYIVQIDVLFSSDRHGIGYARMPDYQTAINNLAETLRVKKS